MNLKRPASNPVEPSAQTIVPASAGGDRGLAVGATAMRICSGVAPVSDEAHEGLGALGSPVPRRTGQEMARLLKQALADAGMPRTSSYEGGGELTGWTCSMGSTGFSLRKTDDGGVDWHLVVSGEPLMQFEEYEDAWDGDVNVLHRPTNPEVLYPRIKAVFESLGIAVQEVRYTGHQTMWDDDVSYNVRTAMPVWLDPGK